MSLFLFIPDHSAVVEEEEEEEEEKEEEEEEEAVARVELRDRCSAIRNKGDRKKADS